MDRALRRRVELTPSGNLTFRYDPEYQAIPDATPLSLSMPLAAASHKKRAVLPFLQGERRRVALQSGAHDAKIRLNRN
ncbi:HipA N-terminal domain-containing protein [Paenarthrobacter sp.]|uniref:HipA N-terminal domain-containing protein n=1 Tax=Paenarthrobacter sp. TaxID=1931993 RepID=UPI002811F2EA|nr:HipA N-terminal domain-containing protein [Paenarthrobacter sp.]